MGFIIHFYIIFGTNLLTQGPVLVSVFFLPISVFRRKGISNGMKPSRRSFLEQTQPRRLGVQVWKSAKLPRGRGACPHPRGPHGAPPTYCFHLYILLYPKNIKGSRNHFSTAATFYTHKIPSWALFRQSAEGELVMEGFYINTIASPMKHG